MKQLDARFAKALSEFNKQEALHFDLDDQYLAQLLV